MPEPDDPQLDPQPDEDDDDDEPLELDLLPIGTDTTLDDDDLHFLDEDEDLHPADGRKENFNSVKKMNFLIHQNQEALIEDPKQNKRLFSTS